MTRDEAFEWLETVPKLSEFGLEWLGGTWVAYQWIGPAEGPDYEFKGSFVDAVEHIKTIHARRQRAADDSSDGDNAGD